MACKREDRFRRNTIAFWLSDEEKAQVEARIILSGLPKGEYYRKAILGQEVTVTAGNYMSNRVAKALEQILEHLKGGNTVVEGSSSLKMTSGSATVLEGSLIKIG